MTYNPLLSGKTSQPMLQPKLKIGEPGDRYEREADAIADRVMSMPEGESLRMQPLEEEEEMMQPKLQMLPEIRMQCPACQQDENIRLQAKKSNGQMSPVIQRPGDGARTPSSTKSSILMLSPVIQRPGDGALYADASFSNRLHSRSGLGNPLPEPLCSEMGRKIGVDFSGVRVHTDSHAVQMNRELGARAFTHGREIYFGADQYSPQSIEGKRLLAHELTHIVQQSNGVNDAQMIQFDLHQDIQHLLDSDDIGSPTTAGNREAIIQSILAMQLTAGDNRIIMERRRVFWEVLRTIEDPIEAENVHTMLESGRLAEAFQHGFHRTVRSNFLTLLSGMFRPGQLAVFAAESFPSAAFGSFRDWLRMNPEYWVVSYIMRRRPGEPARFRWEQETNGEIVFSTSSNLRQVPEALDSSGPNTLEQVVAPQHAIRVMERNPLVGWDGRYYGPEIRITVGVNGPEAALYDLWNNPDAGLLYGFDCFIAAALTELRAIYLYLAEENCTDEFDPLYQDFIIVRDESGTVDTNLIGPSLRPIANAASISDLPPEHYIPLADESAYQRVLRPGDWIILHNTFFQENCLWEFENSIYLGADRFYGHGAGQFALDEYAHVLYSPYGPHLGSVGQPSDWTHDAPDHWTSHMIEYQRRGVEYPFDLRSQWIDVREQVIAFVGQNTKIIPRARPRIELPRTISLR